MIRSGHEITSTRPERSPSEGKLSADSKLFAVVELPVAVEMQQFLTDT